MFSLKCCRYLAASLSVVVHAVCLAFCALVAPDIEAAEGILPVDMRLNSIAYDPLSQSLYASGTNDLLRIDPDTGAIISSFRLGTNVTLLARGAGNFLWAAIDGEHAIRRFNLETMTAEDPVKILPAPVFDLAASPTDPLTAAVATYQVTGIYARISIIRNGVILPNSQRLEDKVAIQGSFLYSGNYRFSLGPNGISGYVPAPGGGVSKFLGPYIYRGSGDIVDFRTLALVGRLPFTGKLAVNEDQSALYEVTAGGPGGSTLLARFESGAMQPSAVAQLPGAASNVITLVAWGTNRVAFNTTSNLYLLETDKLFLPADLGVLRSAPQKSVFGSTFTIDVTITNQGPGVAASVISTNQLSSGLAQFAHAMGAPYQAEALTQNWGVITRDTPVRFTITVRPTTTGTITNVISITSSNDPIPENNVSTAEIFVSPPTGPVTRIDVAPSSLAYDGRRGRLFFLENGALWSIDPDTPLLKGPVGLPASPFGFGSLETASAGGLYVWRRNWPEKVGSDIDKIDPDTLGYSKLLVAGDRISDLKVSPVDPNLLFISDERGSGLFDSGRSRVEYLTFPTVGEFSSDGTRLFLTDPLTCDLQTYEVSESGLRFVRTQTAGSCGIFQESGGLIYFDTGLIYDPNTGEKLPNSLSLAAQSLYVPRPDGKIDLLTRSDSVWSVRRLSAETPRQEILKVSVGPLVDAPTEMIAAGDNRVAFRTATSGLYLVDLRPGPLAGRISLVDPQAALIQFNVIPGRQYQLERADSLGSGGWSPVGASFQPSASPFSQTVDLDASAVGFYRLAQLP